MRLLMNHNGTKMLLDVDSLACLQFLPMYGKDSLTVQQVDDDFFPNEWTDQWVHNVVNFAPKADTQEATSG